MILLFLCEEQELDLKLKRPVGPLAFLKNKAVEKSDSTLPSTTTEAQLDRKPPEYLIFRHFDAHNIMANTSECVPLAYQRGTDTMRQMNVRVRR